jgi:hypothetical protein
MIAHPDESYYRDGRTTETERLVPVVLDATPAWLPRDVRPLAGLAFVIIGLMLTGIVMRAAIFQAGFSAGWAARELAGGLWDQRGWAALVVFSIAGTSFMIWRQNKIDATCTPPRGD